MKKLLIALCLILAAAQGAAAILGVEFKKKAKQKQTLHCFFPNLGFRLKGSLIAYRAFRFYNFVHPKISEILVQSIAILCFFHGKNAAKRLGSLLRGGACFCLRERT
jgi:hypothetical protein